MRNKPEVVEEPHPLSMSKVSAPSPPIRISAVVGFAHMPLITQTYSPPELAGGSVRSGRSVL